MDSSGVTIPKTEDAILNVQYEGTVLMKLSSVISLLATMSLWGRFRKRQKKAKKLQ